MTGAQPQPAGPGRASPGLRLLHVSDLHLSEPQDAAEIAPLAALAARRQAAVLLIAGDFFDHGRVSADTLEAVAAALARVTARVVILPGNHDPAVAGSPYARADLGTHVHVLTAPGGETHELPELDLAIWGRPHSSYDDFRPLDRVPARGPARWQVAMAHGHLVLGPADLQRAYPITPAEIAASGRDYVALGHWDQPADASSGPVTAAYSGSPSRTRTCALVTLGYAAGRRSVSVEQVTVPPPGAGSRLSRQRSGSPA